MASNIDTSKLFTQAITLLTAQNTDEKVPERRLVGFEKCLNHVEPITFSPSMLKAARSVFSPGKTYRFRMTRTAILTTTSGGALLAGTPIYPSQMAEYSPLAALFDECRLWSTRIQVQFYSNGSTPINTPYAISFDPSGTSSPASFGLVCQLPGSKLYSSFNTTAQAARNSWKAPMARSWSSVASTGTGTDPVSGVLGTWNNAIPSNSSFSTSIALYLISCEYEFRNPI